LFVWLFIAERLDYWQKYGHGRYMPRKSAPIDDASRAIIEQLQQDGRRPYATIGKAVGLSEAAVRQRVQKMHDQGVMQIVAVTDPAQVGFARSAMIAINVQGDVEAVSNRIEQLPEISYLILVTGKYDLLAECVAQDDDHLLHVTNTQIRNIPGVVSTETFVYLGLRKQTYNWGTK
jgi:Lrp/AsnC family transcriptional regulator, regulator for asnA, asnC and gidA